MSAALKPCPFCDGTPNFTGDAADWKDDSRYVELSLGCCATMTEGIGWKRARDMTVTARDAELRVTLTEKWNKRALPAEPAQGAAAPAERLLYRLIDNLPSSVYIRLVRCDSEMLAWWWNTRPAKPAQGAAAPVEAVAEVLWHDPTTDLFPPKPGKIIDASIAWMESAPIGTKLYAAPTREAGSVPAVEWLGELLHKAKTEHWRLEKFAQAVRVHLTATNTQSTASEASGEVAK